MPLLLARTSLRTHTYYTSLRSVSKVHPTFLFVYALARRLASLSCRSLNVPFVLRHTRCDRDLWGAIVTVDRSQCVNVEQHSTFLIAASQLNAPSRMFAITELAEAILNELPPRDLLLSNADSIDLSVANVPSLRELSQKTVMVSHASSITTTCGWRDGKRDTFDANEASVEIRFNRSETSGGYAGSREPESSVVLLSNFSMDWVLTVDVVNDVHDLVLCLPNSPSHSWRAPAICLVTCFVMFMIWCSAFLIHSHILGVTCLAHTIASPHQQQNFSIEPSNRFIMPPRNDGNMEPPPLSAATRVFGITELAEQILSDLSPRDLLIVQRVCPNIRYTVQGSSALKKQAFLSPSNGADLELLPDDLRPPHIRSLYIFTSGTSWAVDAPYTSSVSLYLDPKCQIGYGEESWRKMQVSSPPVIRGKIWVRNRRRRTYSERDLRSARGGFTLGDLAQAANRLRQGKHKLKMISFFLHTDMNEARDPLPDLPLNV
ncbi:uncharacterized protein MYCFIDRAFT_171805 [Pseudocercospora fijiensis CIRAD86]|uniref:F-box domain-containing protein n=1 Tax=Pseudocercospora fijiensis (strain CIRAD86) TaxID=383855 RepID=M2Z859_PSEFD|nr:uncharacterized protein MYCFIDRAFT_171805 [Pseudocercospora fijiensis CIRAD86]EME85965.1 hypothetical protein MYCFIDRAFT_171805 [Pseudocercospora fijiensis CIRAD86]